MVKVEGDSDHESAAVSWSGDDGEIIWSRGLRNFGSASRAIDRSRSRSTDRLGLEPKGENNATGQPVYISDRVGNTTISETPLFNPPLQTQNSPAAVS